MRFVESVSSWSARARVEPRENLVIGMWRFPAIELRAAPVELANWMAWSPKFPVVEFIAPLRMLL